MKATTLPEQPDAKSPAGADIRFIMDGETGQMNRVPCVRLLDAGGTSAYTLLPDTQAVSYGITDSGESNIQL